MATSFLDVAANEDGAEGYKPLAEINVTPFVDVMLVLLVIFMVTAPLMMSGVPLELPKNAAATLGHPPQPLVVSINREGKVFVRDTEIADTQLVAHLATLRKDERDAVVYVRGDRGLNYGRIMEVMGQIGQAGYAHVSLIAEAAPAPRR